MKRSNTKHSPEEILAELRTLVTEAESMINKSIDSSDEVVAGLRARYEAAQERLADAYGEAKKRAQAGAAYADDAIRENPYRSLAIAAGAGLFIGLLVSLRRNRSIAALIVVVLLMAGSLSAAAPQYPQGRAMGQGAVMQMTGTYDLESTRGDNPQQAADAATRGLPPGVRDRVYQDLLTRLQPPATMAIERRGRTFTISSSNGPRASFDADGRVHTETMGRRSTSTRASLVGDRLTVASTGNRSTDFTVTFEPLNRGDGLMVTRQMDSDDLRKPVLIRSYYRRVAGEPRWDVYRGAGGFDSGPDRRPRAFVIPDGTQLNAVLDTQISSRTSRDGERFTMTVQGPGEYRDARIDGIIERITPYGAGRNAVEMRVNFDTIRLRNGQTAEFDGVLGSVRTPGGVNMRVRSENVPNTNQTERNVQGGAVGAALGAIIGAIAGGGKGAAIGAVVGGAGGVILAQDRDQYLELPPGTQVTVIVTSGRGR